LRLRLAAGGKQINLQLKQIIIMHIMGYNNCEAVCNANIKADEGLGLLKTIIRIVLRKYKYHVKKIPIN
jgi:hypothetical protein